MALDVDAVKAELGLYDTNATRDARLQKLLTRTIREVELYTDRKLEHSASETLVVRRSETSLINVDRFPITGVLIPDADDIGDGVAPSSSTIWHFDLGLVEDDRFRGRRVAISYAGGYSFSDSPPAGVETIPADLEGAIIEMTVRRWQAEDGTGGSSTGLESVTLEGLGTMRFNRADRTATLDRGLGPQALDYAHILDRYVAYKL